MNFLNMLKECEPNVAQIARDAGVSRQSVHSWTDNRLPRKGAFDKLASNDKYKANLSELDYDLLRSYAPLGRKRG